MIRTADDHSIEKHAARSGLSKVCGGRVLKLILSEAAFGIMFAACLPATTTSPHPPCRIRSSVFERTVIVGAKFGVVVVREGGFSYEVATFRSDEGYEDGRRPTQVRFSSAREDVLRRDFTINGLLMDPETNAIIDYVGGRADIGKKMIRTIGDPGVRFNEDHLRMLRAIRFAANLDFHLDDGVRDAIARHAVKNPGNQRRARTGGIE